MKHFFFATILLISVPGLAFASHTRVEYTFDDMNTTGWSSSNTVDGSPFGGRYLVPFSGDPGLSLYVLDALPPDGSSGDRVVQLEFSVVNFDPFAEGFVVNGINGDSTFHFKLGPDDIVAGSGSNYTFFLTFVLYAVGGCCTDMNIVFTKQSPGDWGLDNVTVDWATSVPLPATLPLMSFALASLFAVRKRRSAVS